MSYAGTFSFTVLGMSGVLESEGGSSISLSCTEEGGGGGGGDCTVLEYGINVFNVNVSPHPNNYTGSICNGAPPAPPPFTFTFEYTLIRNCDGVITEVGTGGGSCNGTVSGTNITCTTTVMTGQGAFEVFFDFVVACA